LGAAEQEGDDMRSMTTRTKAIVTIAGATALATGAVAPAEAHSGTGTVGRHAPTLDMRGTLNPAVFHAFLDRKLDVAQAWAEAMRAKVAAVPSTTALRGVERHAATKRLAKVLAAKRLLGNVPTTGTFATTAAEQAQVAGIRATLADTAAMLETLLANQPLSPTHVRPAARAVNVAKVRGATDARWVWNGWWEGRDGRWDGRDGRRDGARVEGARFGRDGHHCDKR
jgi:hypothetical protein